MHILEIYLHITKYAQNRSTFTDREDLLFPPGSVTMNKEPWSGFEKVCDHLQAKKLYWQTLTIIKILAPVQEKEWGSTRYSSLITCLDSESSELHTKISKFAAIVAYSRHLSSKGDTEGGTYYATEASKTLQKIQTSDHPMPRQALELRMAIFEARESDLDPDTRLEEWEDVSYIARQTDEHGIESHCLTNYMRIAAEKKNSTNVYRHQTRLEEVERILEQDIPSLLSNRYGSWQPGNPKGWAELLDWFKTFDKEHPISRFLLGDTDMSPNEESWDIPLDRYREEQTKYVMLRALGLNKEAKEALTNATKILQCVPMNRVVELGLKDRWLLEWQNPLSSAPLGPVEVLTNRIRLRFGGSELDKQGEAQLKAITGNNQIATLFVLQGGVNNLTPNILQGMIFAEPFNERASESRLAAIQDWLLDDPIFDLDASRLLIAELLLHQSNQVPASEENITSMNRAKAKFVNYIDSLPEGSLKNYLMRQSLLAQQQMLDALLFASSSSSLAAQDLLRLRQQYFELIRKYENTHLSAESPRIGLLYARLGEIALRMPGSIAESKQFYDMAEAYCDELRSELSALGGLEALEAKISSRNALTGHQLFLHRATSILTTKCLKGLEDGETQKANRFMLWDLIQKSKNRALNDAVSLLNAVPKSDMQAIEADARSLDVFKKWRSDIKALYEAKSSPKLDPAAIALARKELHASEVEMKKDPKTAAALAVSKGHSVSCQDMQATFASISAQGVLLVDWFIADVPPIAAKLHMIVLRVKPTQEAPRIYSLERGIAHIAQAWLMKYVTVPDSQQNLKIPSSYQDLKQLAGLVQPLATESSSNDLLVFCPTTAWNIHRIPLHAIEMRPSSNVTSAQERNNQTAASNEDGGMAENLLFLRNRIIYTYSHSLLRLSIASRQSEHSSISLATWKAAVLSPLPSPERSKMRDTQQDVSSDKHAISPTSLKKIREETGALSRYLCAEGNLLTDHQVTRTATISTIKDSDFLFFLGHVHPSSARGPLSSHLLLYHPSANEACLASGDHEPETYLSGETIIEEAQLKQGGHVVMIACGSGVTDARVSDEALGLIPAFFHAGARSATSTLWRIKSEDACLWTRLMREAWEDEESRLREETEGNLDVTMIDLGACFQAAGKGMLGSRGRENLGAWAGYVWHGYWMFPRAPCVIE